MARRSKHPSTRHWPNVATPLPPSLCDAAERALGLSLGHVRVEAGAAARRITEALGAAACAVDGSVLVHPEMAPAPDTPAGRFLLLHEIAHVAQQSLQMRKASDARAAEAEAHRAAAALTAGRTFRCTVALPAGEPAAWDEPGHYYTVYLLALAVGFDELMAYKMAVYCQLPDQCIELDAAVAGFRLTRDGALDNFFDNPVRPPAKAVTNLLSPIAGVVSTTAENAERSELRDLATLSAVQSGLHCFTGRTGGVETNIRRQILEGMTPGEDNLVEFGLALHALGDSYAHRNGDGDMCTIPLGHAFHGGGSRDEIGPDNATLYRRYCGTLYESLERAFARLNPGKDKRPKPRAALDSTFLKSGLDTLTRAPQPKGEQVVYLRNTATHIGQSMRAFRPNQDRLEPILMLNIDGVAIGANVYQRALACARKWAHPPPAAGGR